MKKFVKMSGIVLAILLVLFAGTAFTYRMVKSQGTVDMYTINPGGKGKAILVFTQSSGFKDAVMSELANKVAESDARVSVREITDPGEFREAEWDHIILFTTVESGNIPDAANVLLRNREDPSRYTLVLTADSGIWKHKNYTVDALTMASRDGNRSIAVDRILSAIQ